MPQARYQIDCWDISSDCSRSGKRGNRPLLFLHIYICSAECEGMGISRQSFCLVSTGALFTFGRLMAAEEVSDPNNAKEQIWNWHVQNTDIVQGYPAFSAKYSGPNSLASGGQIRETVSVDFFAG